MFLRNLLLDEKNELHNRSMHITGRFEEVDIESVKVDIESGEVDIERVLMPFAKLPKTNRRTRHTFTKSNSLYATS